MSDGSEFEFFNHQIIANLPYNATEIESFLKYVHNLDFLTKKHVYCRKRKLKKFFSKSIKVENLL